MSNIQSTDSTGTKYVYTFDIWPSETWGFNRALFDVFRLLEARVAMPFTEEEFERFRSALSRNGFSIGTITRVPHQKPEVVL